MTIKEEIIDAYRNRTAIHVRGSRTNAYVRARQLGLKAKRLKDGRYKFVLRDRTSAEVVLDTLRYMDPKYMHATIEEISLALRAAKLA